MMELGYPRDLVMIGAVFGVAAFIWAGAAQERPPKHWVWRVVLGALTLAGLALAALSVPVAVGNWGSPTVLQSGTTSLVIYIIVFWVELVLAALLAFFVIRAGRRDLIMPLILAAVGVHFFALAPIFAQPFLYVVAVLLTVAAVVAALIPSGAVARSFWCGIFAAPVFLVVGTWCLVAGWTVLKNT